MESKNCQLNYFTCKMSSYWDSPKGRKCRYCTALAHIALVAVCISKNEASLCRQQLIAFCTILQALRLITIENQVKLFSFYGLSCLQRLICKPSVEEILVRSARFAELNKLGVFLLLCFFEGKIGSKSLSKVQSN